jgi:prepilin-type N-terminal cleavage/methylation domain-containing protein
MWEAGDSQSGVTLIEMLVVLAVVGLVSAIIAPSMTQSLGSLSMMQAARVLQADLRVSRATAMRTGKTTGLELVQEGRGYRWIGGTRQLPPAVVLTISGPVSFMADGSAEPQSVSLAAHGRRLSFAMDGATGTVVPTTR